MMLVGVKSISQNRWVLTMIAGVQKSSANLDGQTGQRKERWRGVEHKRTIKKISVNEE